VEKRSRVSRSELRFTGRRTDPETGLQLNRNRFYHQQLGRWVSRDPIGYDGGINLYEYVGGRPVGRVDPTGKVTLNTAYSSMFWKGVLQPTQRQTFYEWTRLEKAAGSGWIMSLPKCPSAIKECPKDSGEWEAKNRKGDSWKKLRSVLWDNPVNPSWLEKALHPDTNHPNRSFTWSLRSVAIFNHTNQCTYDQEGKLFRSVPASGTVDFRQAGVWTGHFSHDVKPILVANELDRGANRFSILSNNGTIRRFPGPALRAYYRVRPLWAF